jgi:hypothetical protein
MLFPQPDLQPEITEHVEDRLSELVPVSPDEVEQLQTLGYMIVLANGWIGARQHVS